MRPDTDAAKVVRAGLLEMLPTRRCNGCGKRVRLPGHIRMVATGEYGAVVMFFCSTACDTAQARSFFYAGVRVAGRVRETVAALATQPKGEA